MYDTTYGCLRLQRQFDNAGKNAGVNSRLQVVLCQLLLMNITKVHFSYLDMHDYLYGAIRQTLFERIESLSCSQCHHSSPFAGPTESSAREEPWSARLVQVASTPVAAQSIALSCLHSPSKAWIFFKVTARCRGPEKGLEVCLQIHA